VDTKTRRVARRNPAADMQTLVDLGLADEQRRPPPDPPPGPPPEETAAAEIDAVLVEAGISRTTKDAEAVAALSLLPADTRRAIIRWVRHQKRVRPEPPV
jgi:hypothetical protein